MNIHEATLYRNLKANKVAQAANQLMKLDCDSDKEALLEVLDDYFYDNIDESLENELEDMELSDTILEHSKGMYNNVNISNDKIFIYYR